MVNKTVSAYKLSMIQKEFVYSSPPPSRVGREDTMSGIRGDEVLVGLEDVLGEEGSWVFKVHGSAWTKMEARTDLW